MPRIEAVCIGKEKGEKKHPVERAVFLDGFGIGGDAHAGNWHRQVSILAHEDIEQVRKAGLPDIAPGDFAENVVISGLDLAEMGLGSRLRLGSDVILSLTQIGKVCHAPCSIFFKTGDCIMPRLGVFARVTAGGEVQAGESAEIISVVPRSRFQAVVLTISDRCSRGEAEDTAGPAVRGRLEESLDAHIYRHEIISDDRHTITERLRHYAQGHSIDLIVTVGGTGFSPRDCTPEATREVIERFTPGLDEAMRASSLLKTTHAMLSRGTSGICSSTLIINLPGSKRAAIENLEVVIGALNHGLMKLRGDPSDCG